VQHNGTYFPKCTLVLAKEREWKTIFQASCKNDEASILCPRQLRKFKIPVQFRNRSQLC
jgi:hypothetical protein